MKNNINESIDYFTGIFKIIFIFLNIYFSKISQMFLQTVCLVLAYSVDIIISVWY
jgi:hypothetical protein